MQTFFKLSLIGLCLGLTAMPGAAEGLRKLLNLDEARTWQAVGRLELNNRGFCTATLIAPDRVLTAAHCLFEKDGRVIAADALEFRAGWRQGRSAATRLVRRYVLHPDYSFGNASDQARVAADIAILELDRPILNASIAPFERYRRPSVGDEVQIVSYARDRAEAPSLEDDCGVLARDPEVLVLSCDVNFGASGSPIFVMHDGKPKVASVVSAMAEWQDRDVALGTSLGLPLEELLAELEATSGVFKSKKPGQMSLAAQLGRKISN